MSLDSFLHFISSTNPVGQEATDLAFAEVDPSGRVVSINPFGRLAWGWRSGTELSMELVLSLEGLSSDEPVELPIMEGGLHLRGMRIGKRDGWFLIGFEPGQESKAGDQFSFRSLMDQIPLPALCLNTSGLAWYVNEAAARELGFDAKVLQGRPVLAELVHPEDRWKLAEMLELAARDGSAHASVRYGAHGRMGVLHLVQSVADEFQAVILPASPVGPEEDDYATDSFYRSFLEQGPIGVVYLDASGSVTFENHIFRTIVGEDASNSWLGLHLADIDRLDPISVTALLTSIGNQGTFTGMVRLLDPVSARPTHHLRIHASAIRHPENGVIGTALMIEDHTALISGQQELEWVDRSEKVKAALRELATDHSNPAAFRSSATAMLGEAFGADAALLLGLSIGKDRLVDISTWHRKANTDPNQTAVSLGRAMLADHETSRFGRFLTCGAGAANPVCEALEARECWVDAVRDNEQFAGHFVFAWSSSIRATQWATAARLNEVVRLFEALYSRLQMAARYRMTVAALDDALFGFTFLPDGDRRYHFATEQFELLTGYHPSVFLSEPETSMNWMTEIVHEEDAPLVRAHHRTLQDGHESRITYRVRHADGSIRWLREHATPRTDATGMTAVNGILSDVSEQKAAEIVLLQAKKEAESSDRLKTAFIATMSHEIRTPLGAVNGFAQLLEKELEEFEEELPHDLPEQVHEFVSAITERSQKLLALVHDLFELSNIEMGKAAIQSKLSEPARLVRTSVEKVRSEAEGKGLALRFHEDESGTRCLIDERRFTQVMDNLLSNAIKFTEEGSIDVDIRRSGSRLEIRVQDSGVGIADAYRDNMFDPFSQEEDWRNRRYEGTGLGLALVKRLLEMMNGTIDVESEKGVGSSFLVGFPVSDDPTFKDRTPITPLNGVRAPHSPRQF